MQINLNSLRNPKQQTKEWKRFWQSSVLLPFLHSPAFLLHLNTTVAVFSNTMTGLVRVLYITVYIDVCIDVVCLRSTISISTSVFLQYNYQLVNFLIRHYIITITFYIIEWEFEKLKSYAFKLLLEFLNIFFNLFRVCWILFCII